MRLKTPVIAAIGLAVATTVTLPARADWHGGFGGGGHGGGFGGWHGGGYGGGWRGGYGG